MRAELNNRFLLTDIASRYTNPLHAEMIGRICELEKFVPNEFGIFRVQMDDGFHTVHTSIVKSVDTSMLTVTVYTSNSVYTFSPIDEEEGEDDAA